MTSSSVESTNRLLRVIVALLLRRDEKQLLTLRQQVEILGDLGLRPAEIAEIIGRTANYVNKELVGLRKAKKRKE
jgi:prolipoprotein diacylglyceryltransferase